MLALAMALCLSVCLSVTSRCSIKRDERINRVFGVGAAFDHAVLHCVLRKFGYLQKNKDTSLWNFFLNSGLKKYRHGISIIELVINLAREGGRSERDKLDRCQSTKLIISRSSDARPL